MNIENFEGLYNAPMIDSHCHLADKQFEDDIGEVVGRALQAGLLSMICIADSLAEAKACRTLAEKFDSVFWTTGVHPHVAKDFNESRDIPLMRSMLAHPKCKAIGEIGLDYHYMNSPTEIQKRGFQAQLELAKELKVPAVVHCREAVDDVWQIIESTQSRQLVLHCCTEKWADVERFVRAGYLLSFTGIATYPKSAEVRETITRCPLEQLMIETDSPYLAPIPYRGKRNEPAFVAEVAKCVADMKGIPLEKLIESTVATTKEFFSLP